MPKFSFLVTVQAETEAQARLVMTERLGYDEAYADPTTGEEFDYSITAWERLG